MAAFLHGESIFAQLDHRSGGTLNRLPKIQAGKGREKKRETHR